MQLFYCPNITDAMTMLPDEEARHCIQVLRHRAGDHIQVVDGKGGWYEAEILSADKRSCAIRAIGSKQMPDEKVKLHLAVAPTKQIDRFEWFLEKATEIGVDEVTPLVCRRSERTVLRADRCQRVLLAAMKQSLRAKLPVLHPMTAIQDFFAKQQWPVGSGRFIATCHEVDSQPLSSVVQDLSSVVVMIGPEGDFEESEIQGAAQHGFRPVSLGRSRLRTETAGIVACHTVRLMTIDQPSTGPGKKN